jgi:hypothetical protein
MPHGFPSLPSGGGAGMQNLQKFTAELMVFNRFFMSINRMFRNLKWLQSNVVESPLFLLAAVATFCAYCVYLLHPCCWLHDRFGTDSKYDQLARDAGPLVLVMSVIAFFYYKRLISDDEDKRASAADSGCGRMV